MLSHTTVVYLIIPFFLGMLTRGCDPLEQHDHLINIEPQEVAYDSEIEIRFTNTLDEKVAILTLGCSNNNNEYIPSFTVEKLEGDNWSRAGSPICIEIASPPIIMEPGDTKSITLSVNIGINPDDIPGTFRYRFDVRTVSEDGNPATEKIEEGQRISPAFHITSN